MRTGRAVAVVVVMFGLASGPAGSAAPPGPVRCAPPDPFAVSTQGLRFTSDRSGNKDGYETTSDPSRKPVNITNNPAPDYAVSAQANAGLLAFVSERDGNPEIYCQMVGTSPVNLTQDPSVDTNPSMSSDGTRIAFQSNRSGNFDIWVMNNDGTGLRQLTTDPADDIQPAFSPDGTKIAFASNRTGDYDIFVMNADGSGTPVGVADDPGNDFNPSFSKDGSRIAFDSDEGGNRKIYTVTATGGPETLVTNNAYSNTDPTFSPDGTKIAFVSSRSGNNDIWIINADGSGPSVNLTHNPANDTNPDWQVAPTPPCCPQPRGSPILYLYATRDVATRTLRLYGAYQIKNGPSRCRVGGRRIELFVASRPSAPGRLVADRRTGPKGGYQFEEHPARARYWHTVAPGTSRCRVRSKTIRTEGFG